MATRTARIVAATPVPARGALAVAASGGAAAEVALPDAADAAALAREAASLPGASALESPAEGALRGWLARPAGERAGAGALRAARHALRAAVLGVDEAVALGGGMAAAPPALETDAAPAADPVAACLDPSTTLVVADAATGGPEGLRDLAALARVMDVRLAIRPLRDDAAETARAATLAAALGAAVAVRPGASGGLPAPAVVPAADPPLALREVRIHRVALPLRELYVSSMYLTDRQARTLVELRCADGTVGWGEGHGGPEVAARVAALAREWLGRDLLRERAALRRRFARIGFENRNGRNGLSALAALELGAWDAAARHLGLPLGALLGDARADGSVAIACALPAAVPGAGATRADLAAHMAETANAARVAELAAAYAARWGVTAFKYKSAGSGAGWDLAALGALRARLGPAARLRCDPNAAYGTEEARRLCLAAEPLGLEYHEDPTDGLEGMARLAAHIRTPLATNMCVVAPEHLAAAARRGLRITVLGDVFLWGGVAGLCEMVRAARLLGVTTPAMHSFYETAVVTAANAHLALALGLDDPHPMDCGWPGVAEDVVAPDALRIEGGRLFRPAGPGIGVVPEPDRLAALATAEPVVIR
ncbi:hypothetical protein GCM10010964_35000 [Caldovatus sediminis]|uniref:glucarate dehydratase n=1 Tax=Caldovatus sediminis TaxID=2041189 RepID=A0A8J3EDM7_9PROT|nr:mandelate racemase/muconate lactonizing enzyme family protein [Caldovatus sediminis]GGG44603.1 hypothetical protein GCM10010964_35000 [Caldovatus sediminis]